MDARRSGSIAHLEEIVAALPAAERARFQRIFEVTASVGAVVPPANMRAWIERQFGAVEAVTSQRIVKVTNRWTHEGTLFNDLRSLRPVQSDQEAGLREAIAESRGDAFCHPASDTPADTFGRIRGRQSITAANVAKYDAWHAVIIFDEHNPLGFSEASIQDAIETALEWARTVHQRDPDARYLFLMWNCLWKAGASIVHGHLQAAMTSGQHYAKIEQWRAAARRYRGDYFDDLYRAHAALGLAFAWPDSGPKARQPPGANSTVRVVAHLTPIRAKEVLLLGKAISGAAIYRALLALRAASFNLAVYHPPFGRPAWRDFPVVVRIVDRGDPGSRTSDVGAMELFASSVVSSDPFDVAAALRAAYTDQ